MKTVYLESLKSLLAGKVINYSKFSFLCMYVNVDDWRLYISLGYIAAKDLVASDSVLL